MWHLGEGVCLVFQPEKRLLDMGISALIVIRGALKSHSQAHGRAMSGRREAQEGDICGRWRLDDAITIAVCHPFLFLFHGNCVRGNEATSWVLDEDVA